MSSAIQLNARPTTGHAQREAATLLRLQRIAADHPGRVVLVTSLGAEDMVLTDLIARHRLPIALATLDTGRLHRQTLDLMAAAQVHYGLTIERWVPQAEQAMHFVRSHGDWAMRDSLHLRKACCQIRKLEPLDRLLRGRSAWVTGLRREQSHDRAEVPFEDTDGEGRIKLNALADWSWQDIWHYIARHAVPYNRLHDEHYPSIGCEPCTRAVAHGEDFRAGRWWWENETAKECGLHTRPLPRPTTPSMSPQTHT